MTHVELSELIRNYGIVLAAAVGIAVAAWRARAANRQAAAQLQQAATGHRDFVTDVFSRAVGQLGDDRYEVRLGAIYTRRRIGADFPDYRDMVFDLLYAYVEERSKFLEGSQLPPDLQLVIRIVRESHGVA